MLKKLGVLMLMTAVIAGCSAKNINSSKSDKTELSARQILDRSLQAGAKLKSYKMKMKLNQDLTTSSGEKRNLVSSLHTDLILEPLSFHQKMKMEMEGSEGSYETESYLTGKELYFLDAANEQWSRAPQEMFEQFANSPEQFAHPGEELKKLDELTHDMKAETYSDRYVLKLTASGPVYEDFVRTSLRQSLPPDLLSNEDTWRNLKVKKMRYVLEMDKKTFYPLSIEIYCDVGFSVGGEVTDMKQTLYGTYSDHNHLKAISVPSNVVEQSQILNY